MERFEINPNHEIFVMLDKVCRKRFILHSLAVSPNYLMAIQVREADPELAKRVVAQVFDNALIAAGLLEDPRGMLDRLNTLITDALKVHTGMVVDRLPVGAHYRKLGYHHGERRASECLRAIVSRSVVDRNECIVTRPGATPTTAAAADP